MTLRLATAAAVLALMSGAAMAQETGIAACDTFYRDYEACVGTRVPEAQRATFRQSLEQGRAGIRQAAGNPQARPQLEQMCQQQKVQMTQALSAYGCTFN